jgi:hypothetical protein
LGNKKSSKKSKPISPSVRRKRRERRKERRERNASLESTTSIDPRDKKAQGFERARRSTHGSCHHIFPTSRGGPKEEARNKYIWPGVNLKESEKRHRAWHQMFFNLLPSEVIIIISSWTTKEGGLDRSLIGRKNLEAWKAVFGIKNPYEVTAFIRETFVSVETAILRDNF